MQKTYQALLSINNTGTAETNKHSTPEEHTITEKSKWSQFNSSCLSKQPLSCWTTYCLIGNGAYETLKTKFRPPTPSPFLIHQDRWKANVSRELSLWYFPKTERQWDLFRKYIMVDFLTLHFAVHVKLSAPEKLYWLILSDQNLPDKFQGSVKFCC